MGLLLKKNNILRSWSWLEPLAQCQNVANFSLSYRYYFGKVHGNWVNWFIIPRCYKVAYVNSLFNRSARLWNSLPTECFPLTYDINGF